MPTCSTVRILATTAWCGAAWLEMKSGYVPKVAGDKVEDLTNGPMSLGDAKRKCEESARCLAFSFKPKENEIEDDVQFKVYFTSKVEQVFNDCWKSYKKLEGGGKMGKMGGKKGMVADFEEYSGYLANDGMNKDPFVGHATLQDTSTLSLDEAKEACSSVAECAGFTMRESEVYFKKSWDKPHHDCWTTFLKRNEESTREIPTQEASYYLYYTSEASNYEVSDSEGSDSYYNSESSAPSYYSSEGSNVAYYSSEV